MKKKLRQKCPRCKGRGEIPTHNPGWFGLSHQKCPMCLGKKFI